MCALAVAKASGACPILVTDIDPGRLQFAREFVPGCTTVRIHVQRKPEDMAQSIRQAIHEAGGDEPRVVYECTGVQSSMITACFLPRRAGEVMVIGVGRPTMNELPFMHMSLAEVTSDRQRCGCATGTDLISSRSI
jgi:L-iditol 2-dehydrogenase